MDSVFRSIYTFLILVLVFLSNDTILVNASEGDYLFKAKIDYRLTLKKPFYFHNDGHTIPYFRTDGDVYFMEDTVKLTAAIPNTHGVVWSKKPNTHKEWELHFSFRTHGEGAFGGRGLSFWYTNEPSPSGDFYGVSKVNKGFGLIFDSSEMDTERSVPYIFGFTPEQKSEPDERVAVERSIGSCFREYRNSPNPFWVRVTYYNKEIHVYTDANEGGHAYTECFAAHNIELPPGYYFGIGAATEHHISDDHDLYALEVYEINPPEKRKNKPNRQNNYHMSSDMNQKIKKVEENVKNARRKQANAHRGEANKLLTEQSVAKILENQFRIIESLNLIHDKLDMPKISRDGNGGEGFKSATIQEAGINKKLNELTDDIRRLASIVSTVSENVFRGNQDSNFIESIAQEIQRLGDHVHSTKKDLSDAIDQSSTKAAQAAAAAASQSGGTGAHSNGHGTLYYLIAFVCGCIVMYLFSLVVRSTRSEQRKFI